MALPALTIPVPKVVAPSLKVTVPVGLLPVTVALSVTDSFTDTGFGVAVALGGTACGRSKLPTTITIWTYYNGDQLECFNQLVEQFNSTVGKEKNIRVESSSQGSVNDLETSVLAAAEGKVGAEKLPNIVSSYADTAFTLDQMGLAVDLSPYLTEKEKSAYIAGFLEEGDLMNNGELKVFPIAKSTELLYLNTTDFAPFAEATGVTYADLSTVEGLNEAAHKYYDWTDAQTAAPNDGKALYGRDALTNYLLCGAQELGTTIFDAENGVMTLHFDKPTLRKLWDNYYVPYIKGWCSASGKFRSDDIKIGSLLASVPPRSIILIEDVDAFFRQREQQSQQVKLSFSGFLNALDGVAARYADTMLALPALQAWYADARAESEVIAQAEPYRQG